MPAEDQTDVTFAQLRAERVTKPDGRYLIYYSWPDEPAADDAPADRARHPEPEPWTPQAGPADV